MMTVNDLSQFYPSGALHAEGAWLWRLNAKEIAGAEQPAIRLHALLLVTRGMVVLHIGERQTQLTHGCLSDIDGKRRGFRLTAATTDAEGWLFCFEDPFILSTFKNHPPFDNRYINFVNHHPCIHVGDTSAALLHQYMDSLMHSVRDMDNRNRSTIVELKVSIIYLEIVNYLEHHDLCSLPSPTMTDRTEALFLQFIDLVKVNARTEHTVDFYARQMSITPQYLGRVVREATRATASRLITDAVIGEAKALLANPDMSLQDIARAMAFSDQSVFSKFFKRNTTLTPMQYRNSLGWG